MSAKGYWLLFSVPVWSLTFAPVLGTILLLGVAVVLLRVK